MDIKLVGTRLVRRYNLHKQYKLITMYSKASELLEGQKMFQVLAQCKELEKQGMDIIHFEIGDPDFDTPKPVVDRCIKELRAGNTHYTNSSGLDSFKEVAS